MEIDRGFREISSREEAWDDSREIAVTNEKGAPSTIASGSAALTMVNGNIVCIIMCLLTVIFGGTSCAYLEVLHRSFDKVTYLRKEKERLTKELLYYRERSCLPCLSDEANALEKEEEVNHTVDQADNGHGHNPMLYKAITGLAGHQLPEMYGSVREKTIWAYWHHPDDCPHSGKCKLPPLVQLCVETVQTNKGSFDYRIVHMDEIDKYVNWIELPIHWRGLKPPQQKDALMNALLARYGGVALDISTILLRPLDDYWNEMVEKKATFRGYMYRINGKPWRHAENTAVWFLMARREGIFSTAVRNQVIGMGDKLDTKHYHHWYLAMGDQTILPILLMFNYSLPKCFDDPAVRLPPWDKEHEFGDQSIHYCPENEQPPWYKGITGQERNDTKILLRDPRDGPQLPFAFEGMMAWNLTDTTPRQYVQHLGSPMHGTNCTSHKDCWERIFLRRYYKPPRHGEAPLLSFVKLFHHGKELDGQSREQMLAGKQTYFYHWLKLAGVVKS